MKKSIPNLYKITSVGAVLIFLAVVASFALNYSVLNKHFKPSVNAFNENGRWVE